jgi:ElaB/YqjD/DUF883 family membrane-anchored ribosome-binding protein
MSTPPRKTSSPTEEINQDIAQTRQRLGDTAEALAHKANVPARMKDKAHETTQAAAAKAAEVTHQARQAAEKAMANLPEPVAHRVERVVATVRERPVPTAAAVVFVLLLLRLLLRRNR